MKLNTTSTAVDVNMFQVSTSTVALPLSNFAVFQSDVKQSNERIKTAKRSLFVSDPSRRARILVTYKFSVGLVLMYL